MAQSRFPGEEADIEAKADQQYSEFWKTTPDIGGKDNMQFKDLDFLIAFFSFYEACGHRIGIPELDEFAYEVIIKSSEKAGKLIDEYWVGHTKAWEIPGTEDMKPYINKKDKLGKWLMGTAGFAILSAILSGIMTLVLR